MLETAPTAARRAVAAAISWRSGIIESPFGHRPANRLPDGCGPAPRLHGSRVHVLDFECPRGLGPDLPGQVGVVDQRNAIRRNYLLQFRQPRPLRQLARKTLLQDTD